MTNPIPATSATLGSTVPPETKAKLQQKAQEFEAFYLYQFINLTMPKNESKIMHGGAGEDMFQQHLQEELANKMAQNGGFGIASKVYAELLRQQERGQDTTIPPAGIPDAVLLNTQTPLPQ